MAMRLIDETQEVACRTAEANAIRAKTGGTAPIPYDFQNGKGFSDAIAGISGGAPEWVSFLANATDSNSNAGTVLFASPPVPSRHLETHFESVTSLKGYAWFNNDINLVPKKITISSQKPIKSMYCFIDGVSTNLRMAALKEIDLSGCDFSQCTSYYYAFRGATGLETIRGTIDFSLVTSSSALDYMFASSGVSLENVEFAPNTLSISPSTGGRTTFAKLTALTDASIVSLANALKAGTHSIELHSTVKGKLSTIMGTVSQVTDDIETYDFFTASETGDTSLEDFITLTKGWTIA